MIVGSVYPNGDAIVPLRLRGTGGIAIELQAVLDTGFGDWLTLSREEINALALPFREEGRYTLADGSEVISPVFLAEAEWFGRWRRILVAEMRGAPLLGMALLRGCFLGIEVLDGGRVEIRSLQD